MIGGGGRVGLVEAAIHALGDVLGSLVHQLIGYLGDLVGLVVLKALGKVAGGGLHVLGGIANHLFQVSGGKVSVLLVEGDLVAQHQDGNGGDQHQVGGDQQRQQREQQGNVGDEDVLLLDFQAELIELGEEVHQTVLALRVRVLGGVLLGGFVLDTAVALQVDEGAGNIAVVIVQQSNGFLIAEYLRRNQ